MNGEKEIKATILLYGCTQEIRREVEYMGQQLGYMSRGVSELLEIYEDSLSQMTVLLVDASDYNTDYPALMETIRRQTPEIGILALLPDDSMTYCNRMLDAGADIAFAAEEMGRLLPECILDLQKITSVASRKDRLVISEKEEKQMTKKKGILQTPVSRRSFLKGSIAATAAVGAMSMFGCSAPVDETTAGATPEETIPETTPEAPENPMIEEHVYCGVCRGNCTGGCFLNVHVRDGKVVRTSAKDMPDTRYNRTCIKGLTHPYRMYNADRLKYPLRRVGERGAGQWEQITWDEAIKEITDKWKAYQSEFGTESVAFFKGSGNYAVASGEAMGSASNRLVNTIGASTISSDTDVAGMQGHFINLGSGLMTTGNEPADLLNAKTIMVWGANPVNSQQQTTHFILEAQERGAKLIVIDPAFSGTAAKADIFVPIRAGSDAVLAFAMMNIVLKNDWVDWNFVKNHTDAPMLVKAEDKKYLRISDVRELGAEEVDAPVVMGVDGNVDIPANILDPVVHGTFEINGHSVTTVFDLMVDSIAEYTPEKAATICNISVEQIKEITEIYAKQTPSTIYTYFGLDHYVNGHYNLRAVAVLAELTGNLGKPGAFCGNQESVCGNFINFMTPYTVAGAIPSTRSVPILKLLETLENGEFAGQPITIKALYNTNSNILGNMIERKKNLECFNKIEFIVVADMNMNETAQYADIVLPVAHWFEVDDAFGNWHAHPYTLLQEKAVEPPYECKSDYEIYQLLMEGMGYPNAYNPDPMEFVREWLDTDGARAVGLTVEALKEKKAIRYTPTEHHIHGEGGAFPTAIGRALFYNESPAVAIDYGQSWNPDHERLPYWEPPHEAWYENPLHEKYPFHVQNVHPKWRTHSQWWDVSVLKEVSGEPTMHINTVDADAKGIQTGDIVKIFNDRGYVVMKAEINNGVQPGTITIPKGWEKQQFIDGHYQDLTSKVMNPMINNSAYFDVLADIEKV